MQCGDARSLALPEVGGVQIIGESPHQAGVALQALRAMADKLQLAPVLRAEIRQGRGVSVVHAWLDDAALAAWTPGHDTLGLHAHLEHSSASAHERPHVPPDVPLNEPPDAPPDARPDEPAMEREILAALLACPQAVAFPDIEALASSVRVRRHIALDARRTALAFKTQAAERPAEFWHYDEEHGFLLNPGADLVQALVSATQPEATGRLYDFSCYRATEYVILLGMARELRDHNPALYAELTHHCRHDAIRSGAFHDVFLVEQGVDTPMPVRYYVPGDRVWFRNPDEHSSDASGFEGSWVIYMGGGLFSNFWRRDDPFTLEAKCLEVHHWRHATFVDAQGDLRIDETVALAHCEATRRNPEAHAAILERMMRLRDPRGVYAEGGCIDATREYPRGVIGQGCELRLPALDQVAKV